MLFYTIVLPLGLLLLFFTFFIVKQQSAAVVERFGKFVSVRQSGLQLKIPIIDNVINGIIIAAALSQFLYWLGFSVLILGFNSFLLSVLLISLNFILHVP